MAQIVDEGHKRTDKTIEEIEKRLEKEYQQASKEVTAKWEDYWRRHAAKDSIKQQQVASGKITLEEYTEWKHGQLCIGQRWKDLKDQLAQDLTNTDAKARSITQGYMPEVYALNHNYATFQVERDSMIDTSYTLYNRRAVENMIRDDRSLLPYPSKDSPTAKMLMEHKDREWNRQHIHSAITQGVLQGESNPQIAKRLQNVVGMDKKAAIRNARTMMTGVENKARQDAYDDLKEKGIDIREKWIATLDGRTRASHRWMHGSYKDPETGEYDNGLRYPADPNGDPSEVYNCRCCEIAEVLGHSIDTPKYSPKMKNMTFDEWQRAKGRAPWDNFNLPSMNDAFNSLIGKDFEQLFDAMTNIADAHVGEDFEKLWEQVNNGTLNNDDARTIRRVLKKNGMVTKIETKKKVLEAKEVIEDTKKVVKNTTDFQKALNIDGIDRWSRELNTRWKEFAEPYNTDMSAEDLQAIYASGWSRGYIDTGHSFDINRKFYTPENVGKPLSALFNEDDIKTITALDNAIANHKTQEDACFVRFADKGAIRSIFGLDDKQMNALLNATDLESDELDMLNDALVGTVSLSHSYTSTSANPELNVFTHYYFERHINVPEGTNAWAAANNGDESEVVFGRELETVLTGITIGDDKVILHEAFVGYGKK